MSNQEAERRARARQVSARLTAQLLNDPDVTLIGVAEVDSPDGKEKEPIVRVHVRERWFTTAPTDRVQIPSRVDGIRVVVVPGEYSLD